MDVAEKLNLATEIVKEAGLIDEVEPEEVVQLANETNNNDFKKIAKVISYIRKRHIEKKGRAEAFRHSFPERSIATDPEKGKFRRSDGSMREIGEPLPNKTLEVKAKRLEDSKTYKSIMTLMHTSLYAVFALERIDILQKALEKINDENIKEYHRIEYMKLFLQETRKPEKAKDFDINVNIQQNNISVSQINKKLDEISSKLINADAGSIISLLEQNKEKENAEQQFERP